MNIYFPSFDPATPGTLIDSENAKKVKAFIEAFNRITVVLGAKSALHISESNVVLELNITDVALTDRVRAIEDLLSGLTRQSVTYCDGGSSSSRTMLMS